MGFTFSPLRYPGGKTRLASFVKGLIRTNDLMGGRYVEPFAGAAGIAWSLLFEDYVSEVHINDIDRSIYAFWFSVFNYTDDLCRLIRDTPVTLDSWFIQKAVQDDFSASPLELGFSTFFLNRTNRSGIIRGGIIGGKQQDGPYKLDARYNKTDLIRRIQRIASYKSRVYLHNQEGINFIENKVATLPLNSLVFIDPPYYLKGHDLYETRYNAEDHVALASFVTTNLTQKWVVSYDNVPPVRRLYSQHRQLAYHLSYSANDRYMGSELLIVSDDLVIPNVAKPSFSLLSEATS